MSFISIPNFSKLNGEAQARYEDQIKQSGKITHMKKIITTLSVLALFTLSTVFGETPIKVTVGTEGTMAPFTYYDDKNVITGFDVEVVKEISRHDPSLQFEFAISVWDTLFPGLDANHYQMLANQIAHNKDREARYYLTEETYFKGGTQVIVLKDRVDIKTVADLKGKRVGVGIGSNHARVIEDWNAANGNGATIIYFDGDISTMFQDLVNLRVDAIINSLITALDKAKINNIEITLVDKPIYDAPIHFIFQKNAEGKALQEKVDDALRAMKKDGSLSKLSLQFFGHDFTN